MNITHANPNAAQRAIRFAVLNGVPSCPRAVAVLEARGIDVGELEQRIRQNQEWRN